MKNKNGDVTGVFTLIVSLAILIITIMYVINMLTPFIWYQKLQNIADKYIYVVERFGYLTESEREELYKELIKEGFDINNVYLECPNKRLAYGEKFNFNLTYKLKLEYGMLKNTIERETKEVLLHVKKYGYSKI